MDEPFTNGTALTEGETEDQHADDLQPLDEVQRLKDQLVAEQQESKTMKIKLSQLYARVGELTIEKEELEKKLSHEAVLLYDHQALLRWSDTSDCSALKDTLGRPTNIYEGSAVVIGKCVYVGGGRCKPVDNERFVFVYDYENDKWSSRIRTNRRKFAIVAYQGKLVLTGGAPISAPSEYLNSLIEWDDETWKESSYPPMQIPRAQHTAVGYGQHIVVAGGIANDGNETNTVEIFNGSGWYFVPPLPVKFFHATSAVFEESWYIMGGEKQGKHTYYASFDCIIKAIMQDNAREPGELWKFLEETQYTNSTIAVFENCILALGGAFAGGKKDIYVYFPARRTWLQLDTSLPRAMYAVIAVVIPTGELLLIGGCAALTSFNEVYRGTLYRPVLSTQLES